MLEISTGSQTTRGHAASLAAANGGRVAKSDTSSLRTHRSRPRQAAAALGFCLALVAASLTHVGCGAPAPLSPEDATQAANLPPGAQPRQSETAEAPPTASEPDAEIAGVGSGKKGHDYGGGLITEPASAYWRTREKIAFEIAIPKALELFKALDPEGQGPASHEEFMQKVVRDNRIELPELPEGKHYRYDPETEQLWVVSGE